MGMDRMVQKKKFPLKWIIGGAAALALAGVFIYQLGFADNRPAANAPASQIRVATVVKGDFQEYFQANCFVAPAHSVYIDLQEAGIVQSVSAEQGKVVAQGEVLVRLHNNELEAQLASVDGSLRSAADDQENNRLRLKQAELKNQNDLLEIDHQIRLLEIELDKKNYPANADNIPEFLVKKAKDEVDFWKKKREILVKSQEVDLALLAQERAKIGNAVDLLRLNRQRLADRIASLTVTAPVLGQVTSFNASVGEMKSPGARLAQLDTMDKLEMKAVLDEYYLPKIAVGAGGSFKFLNSAGDETEGSATISWVSPDVKSNTFEVDFRFDTVPPGLRIGQRFTVRVELGKKRPAVLLDLGPFFQATGGSWVYLVDPSGAAAVKRPITPGKSNPDFLEVYQGLAPGDRVIVSDYTAFAGREKIEIR
jgi:HlyD family secretion protein